MIKFTNYRNNDEEIMTTMFGNTNSFVKEIRMTSWVCPEQYECYDADGNMICYFHLRNNKFKVVYDNDTIFETFVPGNGCSFDDTNERYQTLKYALHVVGVYHNRNL